MTDLIEKRNALLARMADTVKGFENNLGKPGVEVVVHAGEGVAMGFGRVGSVWCVFIKDEDGTKRPWSDSPIRLRILAFSCLTGLGVAVEEALQDQIVCLEKALTSMNR